MKPKQLKNQLRIEQDAHSQLSAYAYAEFESERLRDIIDNIPSAVAVLEKPNATVIFANKRAVKLLGENPCGFKLEKFATNLKTYMQGGVLPAEQLYWYRALYNEETVLNSPVIIERSGGRCLTVNMSAKPLYGKNGEVNAAVVIFDDITQQVKIQEALRESEERLKMAQKIAHLGSWEYCTKEDKAIWSDELFRIFGIKPQKYGPNTAEYVMHIYPEDRERINKLMEQMLFEAKLFSKISFDYRILTRDGSIRFVHSERMVRELSEDGKPLRVIGIEQDITERKHIEQKLESYAKNLEQIIDERTRQLQNAERLAAIGQTAGMIGHDIRNPLQAIAGELFLMKQEMDASLDSNCKTEVQESLSSIQHQVDYINKIISDLQDFARPLKPEMVDVDVQTAIPEALGTVAIPESMRLVEEYAGGLQLKTDSTFLKRVLVNLVNNAIQAMPDGGTLTVKAFHEKGGVAITVEDTGVGIPDEVKPKLFQPLMTTKSKGQGFGLAVVKRLVEVQGGSISFESKVGVGTRFKIFFPKLK